MPRSAGATRRASASRPKARRSDERCLDAVSVQQLALDFRGLDRFRAHHFDDDLKPVGLVQVPHGTDNNAALAQEMHLPNRQAFGLEGEIRPVDVLPVPLHERYCNHLSPEIKPYNER